MHCREKKIIFFPFSIYSHSLSDEFNTFNIYTTPQLTWIKKKKLTNVGKKILSRIKCEKVAYIFKLNLNSNFPLYLSLSLSYFAYTDGAISSFFASQQNEKLAINIAYQLFFLNYRLANSSVTWLLCSEIRKYIKLSSHKKNWPRGKLTHSFGFTTPLVELAKLIMGVSASKDARNLQIP